MGLLSMFKRKDKRNNYSFDEDDRRNSSEIRKINAEKKKILAEIEIEKAKFDLEKTRLELDLLREEYEDDEPEIDINTNNPDSMLTSLLMNVFLRNNAQNSQSQPSNSTPQTADTSPQSSVLTENDIKNIVSNIPPKYIKMIKKKNDDELLSLGKIQFPQFNEQQLKQLITYIKSNN